MNPPTEEKRPVTLRELLAGLTTQAVPSVSVAGVCCHSKQLRAGEVFVAVRGPNHDGHAFLEEALSRGASALVVERAPASAVPCPVVVVADTARVLPVVAARWYGEPASHLRIIGVTGTNGKTTTTYLLKAVLEAAGQGVGMLGTVAYQIGERTLPSTNTTPGALELQRLLSKTVEQRLGWCVMEVSSHALDQGRIDGLRLDAAVFTNLGSDHLDYHKTLERYAQAKRKLFTYLRRDGRAVINADDTYGRALIDAAEPSSLVSYSIEPSAMAGATSLTDRPAAPATVSARRVVCTWEGTHLILDSPWGTLPVSTPLVGRHNVANITAACATALSLGLSGEAIRRAMAEFLQVPGRMERLPNDAGCAIVIDYAHTADALRLVLLSLRELVRGRLIVVFGCGGNRDQSKRQEMGRLASLLADGVVLTSDNPRGENPMAIIRQIQGGFGPDFREFVVIPDREQAIQAALSTARADDAVLIAGKGHEAYQIFDHIAVPFSDREVAERYCAQSSKQFPVTP